MAQNKAPIWLEVALNGGAGRHLQPNIPITPDEIIADAIAAVQMGAAIVHLHVYEPSTGKPVENAALYARVIEGIKDQVDAIVYPTIALSGTCRERFACLEDLAKRGLLEWAALDPGSVNILHRQAVNKRNAGFVYSTPIDHIKYGLDLSAEYQFHPSFAVYEPGFARLGAALAVAQENLPEPIFRIMLSDELLFGLPPKDYAIDTYRLLLSEVAPSFPWMVSGIGGDVMTIAETAIGQGFHLRVGLEDAPLHTEQKNLDLVEAAVTLVGKMGREFASPETIRQTFKERAA